MAQGPEHLFSARFKTWMAAGLTAGVIYGVQAPAALAQAQGGETEVRKTMPARPAQPPAQPQAHQLDMPQTAAPAAAPSAPAAAAQAQSPVGGAPSQAAPAQPAEIAAQPAQPAGAGANGGDWQTGLAARPDAGDVQDAAAIATVQKVNDYFNGMTTLQGTFLQTDPDNKEKRGKFYFERPGKVRFEYAPPSKLVIVSDGKYLAIEDYDMKTTDRYPIGMTPFRLLLSEKVDLLQEARIISVDEGEEAVVLTVEDKSSDSPGRIRLFFNKSDMSLRQWIISDPQGLDTRIQVADLQANKELSENLFQFSKSLGFKNLSQ
jgi:outer membrane lipoprotein-sorting protein